MIPTLSLFPKTPISTNLTVASSVSHNTPKPKPKHFLNQTLKSLSKAGKLEEALCLIKSSPSDFSNPEAYSIILHACISERSLHLGNELYTLLQQDKNSNTLLKDPTLQSKIITLFSVCGHVNLARSFFDGLLENSDLPESVWTAMAIGYLRNRFFNAALVVYVDMLCHFLQPSDFTFSMALKACADLNYLLVGRSVHAQIMKSHGKADQVVNNALFKLYIKCGCFDEAAKLFAEMPDRNVVSWNSLIASFAERNKVFESMEVFRRMQEQGIGFSWVTLTTMLSVCTLITALRTGKEMHSQILKSSDIPDILLLNALLDMYGKCGEVTLCRKVFDGMIRKDLTSWNTMLNCYAINGCMEGALKLFGEMVDSGIKPDSVTFIALLSGCSDAGITAEGQRLFDRMKIDFGISPSLEHYACLVDILGRAGQIKEALEIIKNMPMKPSGSIWGSLLNSCRLHRNVILGEQVGNKLFELEPHNAGNYVILSNIYADAGMWEDVNKIRGMMKSKGITKEAGCSWIIVKEKVHTFVAGGEFEFRNSTEYKKIWNELISSMRLNGYVTDRSVVLHDVDEETKTMWVCGHSERIATVYALIHTSAGMPIRITKNLRVCPDCHSWMKIVSLITERVIVLRDTNRFHHFTQGKCSCKDYW